MRSRLLWLSVLPATLTAVFGAGAVAYVLAASADPVAGWTGLVLISAGLGFVVVLVVTAKRASGFARSVLERVGALRSSAAQGQVEMQRLIEQLRRGERPMAPAEVPPAPAGGDAFTILERDLNGVLLAAQVAVVQAANVTRATTAGQQVEVFVNLARRLQSLVHREIQLLDDLENQVEDPDLLKGLFQVDHLATRIRRHAENLAVLGGAASRRQWSRPVTLTEVLRSAIAEVEHYSRVKLVPPIEGSLNGHAVADVIHLVAELVENATMFSAPQTQVLLRAQIVTAGVAVEVEDRGLGMPLSDQDRVNRLLTESDRIDIGDLLRDGRIGIFVVSAIARRHGITVRLQTNIYGGIQAILILPHGLLGAPPQRRDSWQHPHSQQTVELARPEPVSALAARAVAATPTLPSHTQPPSAYDPAAAVAHRAQAGQTARAAQPETPESAYVATTSHPPAPTAGPDVHRVAGQGVRPPLPHRHRQAHLAPQLQDVPVTRTEEPVGDQDPGLIAAFMRGVSQGETEPDKEDGFRGRTDSVS
jgi:signal transduction histidine kinase